MPVIKRYPNRKLYDTEAKQYITLDGIAEFVRQGKDVTVIDHVSGEDLTTLTLTQIIVEQEKKQSGRMPRAILAGLIQAGGDRWNALQRSIAAPQNFFKQFEEEINNRIQALVEKGELTEREGKNLLHKLLRPTLPLITGEYISEADIERILLDHQIPTRQDLDEIARKLDELTSKLGDKVEEIS